ncbi:MAG: hypothetical protein OXI30_14070 [Chloroflexota bacterium]|nr:hypothetical protein [Chloroflexota bacterium]
MDNETIAVVAAVLINVVAVGWNIRETFVLHRQTKELQASNANLQNEVNRLSVHLNQEINRLNRMNELTRDLYISILRTRFKWDLVRLQNGESTDRASVLNDSWTEEFTSMFVAFEGSILEMRAIANVIGDEELLIFIQTLRNSAPIFDGNDVHPTDDNAWKNQINEFCNNATALHEKVFRLLEEVTESS